MTLAPPRMDRFFSIPRADLRVQLLLALAADIYVAEPIWPTSLLAAFRRTMRLAREPTVTPRRNLHARPA